MSLKRLSLIVAIALLSSVEIFALGNGAIKGRIMGPDGLPAIGANVFTYVGSTLRGASTDMDGRFMIKPLPAGTYNLMITSLGFDTLKITNIKVMGDELVFLPEYAMEYKSITGGVFVVSEYREPLINKIEPSTIHVLPETFTKSPTKTSLTTMISAQSSDIFQADEGEPLYFRGARAGSVVYLIDGVKSFGTNDAFPSAAIGSMRIYTGGVPAQYGDLIGGIVVIETKSYLDMYNQ